MFDSYEDTGLDGKMVHHEFIKVWLLFQPAFQ
jgi:hypothetical protein